MNPEVPDKKITGTMAEAVQRKSTLDKHALRKIAHRLEEGYSRQANYEGMKQEYSDHTTLSDLIATTPDREQVNRHHVLNKRVKSQNRAEASLAIQPTC